MKSNLTILFFCFTLVSQAQIDSGFTNKAEAKNQIVNGVREGKWIVYFDSAMHYTEDNNASYYDLIIFKGGNPSGYENMYKRNGLLHSQIPYVNGVETGTAKYYDENGKLTWEIPLVAGQETGIAKLHYDNGSVWQEFTFSGNKKNGDSKMFNKDGKLKSEVNFTDDNRNGVQTDYYENGKIQIETPYVSGVVTGVKKNYDESGKLMSEVVYKDGQTDGSIKGYYYYESGKIKGEETFINNKPDGIAKDYYESGELSGETPYSNGVLNGTAKEYYKNGKLKFETTYNNDVVEANKIFDENGLIEKGYNGVTWESNHFLKWTDFQGTPDTTMGFQALTYWSLTYTYKQSKDSLRLQTIASFNKATSWLKKGKASRYLLDHEQGHFDIAEICRRRLCRYLKDSAAITRANCISVINDAINRFSKEGGDMQVLYDAETSHSKIEPKQEEWKKKIEEELKSLDKYSSDIVVLGFVN